MSTLRIAILSKVDLVSRSLKIPEWDCTVHVRTMTAGDRDRFEARQQKDPYADIRARLAVATVCDEQGDLLFTEADIPALSGKSAKALDRIFAVAVKLNGISKEDVDDLKKD